MASFTLTRPSTSSSRQAATVGFAPVQGSTERSSLRQPLQDNAPNDGWRSSTIKYEVALKELVADGPTQPPTTQRMSHVFNLYDGFTEAIPSLAAIFRLFRVEFVRGIYSSISSVLSEAGSIPYFEKVDVLSRERAILEAELRAADTDVLVEDLRKQLSKSQNLMSFYEHEVGRLTKENNRLSEEIHRMGLDAEATAKQQRADFLSVDEECHRLNKENRELQLQVFKLGKDHRDQQTGQTLYAQFKSSKTDTLQSMFEQGSEEATLLLLLHQLEQLENQQLSEYENEIFKGTPAELPSLRARFVKSVELLIEEQHNVNGRYRLLTKPSIKGPPQTKENAEDENDKWKARIDEIIKDDGSKQIVRP